MSVFVNLNAYALRVPYPAVDVAFVKQIGKRRKYLSGFFHYKK